MNEKYNHPYDPYNTELFFDLSADLLFIAGFDGYFKKVNPASCQLLEYTVEELLSRPINSFIHEDDRKITSQNRDNIRAGIPLLNFENRYVTKSGDIIWLSWTSMPLEDLELVYAIAKNITHTKKMEEERNALLINLQKINKDLKKLTYTASHDMRSPVNNLLTVYSLMDTSKIEDEETFEYIEISKKATEGLKQTLDNYVDNISHNENLIAQREQLSFEKSLLSVCDSIKSLIKCTRTTLVHDFSEADTIMFNRAYLESIFLNLITNAIKYANPEIMPIITISSKKNDDITQLIFTDNGQGFDIKKVKHKIFRLNQKFHNTPDSKGIGLYLIYHHLMDMGGTIDVESQIGVGTTFTINFKN